MYQWFVLLHLLFHPRRPTISSVMASQTVFQTHLLLHMLELLTQLALHSPEEILRCVNDILYDNLPSTNLIKIEMLAVDKGMAFSCRINGTSA
jgi:hypothetical protein